VPRRHPVEFPPKVLYLIEAGRPVAEIAVQLGVSDQTIYNCATRTGSIEGCAPGCRRLRPLYPSCRSIR
jgi:transposase